MKQPKLSFITNSKRRTEMDDKKNKEPRAKKARKDPENDLKESLERKCEEKENICRVKFSSTMKDAVKTLCQVCSLAVTLTTMRGHTKSAHGLSVAEYKEKYGNHRTQIIEKIFHSCGLCNQVSLTICSYACLVTNRSSLH